LDGAREPLDLAGIAAADEGDGTIDGEEAYGAGLQLIEIFVGVDVEHDEWPGLRRCPLLIDFLERQRDALAHVLEAVLAGRL
jgi:hypothetical protein